MAGQLLVFAHTSPFRTAPRFIRSPVVPLRRPTADTALLVQAATMGMTQIYESGERMLQGAESATKPGNMSPVR